MRKILGMLGSLLLIAAISACILFFFLLWRSPALEKGEAHTYYLGKSSSARAVAAASPLSKLFLGDVKGESASYAGDRYLEFSEKYRAELLFSETVCGITSYYLYSPRFGGGVELNGGTVNLQIAVGNGRTVVGTPLIFGGW